MGLIFVERGFRHRQWRDIETCIDDLLTPYQEPNEGELEYLREQIVHMRGCLTRFMTRTALSTDDLELIFYTSIDLVEEDDG